WYAHRSPIRVGVLIRRGRVLIVADGLDLSCRWRLSEIALAHAQASPAGVGSGSPHLARRVARRGDARPSRPDSRGPRGLVAAASPNGGPRLQPSRPRVRSQPPSGPAPSRPDG